MTSRSWIRPFPLCRGGSSTKVEEASHREAEASIDADVIHSFRTILTDAPYDLQRDGRPRVRAALTKRLQVDGWSPPIRISPDLNLTVSGFKGQIALCLQFGNVCRSYADLLKLQLLFDSRRADAAIYVTSTTGAASLEAANLAHLNRLLNELKLFRGIINIPIKLFGVE
jgi:hypothetical protein